MLSPLLIESLVVKLGIVTGVDIIIIVAYGMPVNYQISPLIYRIASVGWTK